MGCRFCASTIGGLDAGPDYHRRMLDQVYRIQKRFRESGFPMWYVMGTGEPLDNYDNLLRFIRMLSDETRAEYQPEKSSLYPPAVLVPRIRSWQMRRPSDYAGAYPFMRPARRSAKTLMPSCQ